MDIEAIKKDVHGIILQSNIIPQDSILKDDTLLNEYGVDSVGIVELIISIEEKYDFEFSSNKLNRKDFETVNSISLLVHKLVLHNKENV